MGEKRILTDCDNCLLNWEYAFHVWMKTKGHQVKVDDKGLHWNLGKQYGISDDKTFELVEQFNESAAIGFLPPLRDAVEYVRKLHYEHGYIFHAVTSLSDDPAAAELRRMNLEKVFGDTVFEEVKCLPLLSSKKEYLSQFKDSGYYWIEDHIDHATEGYELGLQTLLMEHGYNMNYTGPITLVKNWQEIYKLISCSI